MNLMERRERDRELLCSWHASLEADRGARAELRRCRGPLDMMLVRPFGELLAAMHPAAVASPGGPTGVDPWQIAALARTATVLCRAAAVDPEVGVAEAMAEEVRGRTVVSPLRADALFRCPDADEACRILVSLQGLFGACDPADLHGAMSNWDRKRRDWAMAFNLAVARIKRPA
jgi:CRISPR type I-E-associated protein CasB/Cse2